MLLSHFRSLLFLVAPVASAVVLLSVCTSRVAAQQETDTQQKTEPNDSFATPNLLFGETTLRLGGSLNPEDRDFFGFYAVGAGQSADFTSLPDGGTSSFRISGINPTVDSSSPTAFPVKLDFNTPTASFTMTGVSAAPEPGSITFLFVGGLAGILVRRRKRR